MKQTEAETGRVGWKLVISPKRGRRIYFSHIIVSISLSSYEKYIAYMWSEIQRRRVLVFLEGSLVWSSVGEDSWSQTSNLFVAIRGNSWSYIILPLVRGRRTNAAVRPSRDAGSTPKKTTHGCRNIMSICNHFRIEWDNMERTKGNQNIKNI